MSKVHELLLLLVSQVWCNPEALTFQGGDIPPGGCLLISRLAFHGCAGHGHSSSQPPLRVTIL